MIYCLINENRRICRISRIPLAVLSTPIQKLENISRLLNTNVYIKRDDLTGIGLGGSKVRNLEFLLADTKRKGNQLLEYLMDTDVRFMDTDSYDDIYAEMDRVGKASGKKYYKIPCGGSNAGVELVSVLHRGESEASDHA